MGFTIDDDAGRMVSDECDTVAVCWPDRGWTVTGRRGVYSRNQAITAMILAESYAAGKTADDVFVRGWEAELATPAYGYVEEDPRG
ncbi:hypothetical protein [Nonomuraea pusilla]|uniref:Uncharacterized protein n=1 Tax=Nonomuraea pusilla TaxID=46177 RepID=A0A1H8K5K8_9ACTN|nr:hypothetical protein [Nonomuraea pusilla]SEN88290.1 hypothetical protein SAMN05660976_08531 [Nonomuraea pusilla]